MEYITKLIKDIHNTAKEKGWWDDDRSVGEVIALMHSELSEALEFEREKNKSKYDDVNYLKHYSNSSGEISNDKNEEFKKPDGLLVELADVIIRIYDFVGKLGKADDFSMILEEKHEFNKTRPYKHGKTL